MDLELKKVFLAIGRALLENGYMFKSFLLLTILILITIIIYICRE